VAVFGQKDYQQLMVIRQMVRQLALPIEVVGHPTERAPDGLALSSRNGYLSAPERTEAVALSQTLSQLAQALRAGATDAAALEQHAVQQLQQRGWAPDYVVIRQRSNLQAPPPTELAALAQAQQLVVLAAARLGSTRLIDNLEV
jgi:pantoate--beta-alanine ligase